jgi:hypothetical protein
MDAFSPQIYGNYPVLDSVLLNYLDIESLIQRHQVNPEAFETQGSLNLLAQRFDLPLSPTFQAFLDRYDAKYPTVRSYFLPGADPKRIILKAAETGELQAFYLGLRRNPEYKEPYVLKEAMRRAARGGHQVMIDLIKDLGGTSTDVELIGTVQGGHLEKLKLLIAQRPELSQRLLFQLTASSARSGHLATFKYLITLWTPLPKYWNYLSFSAGASGNQAMVDYVIMQYGDNYTQVIIGAISGSHLDLAIQYMENPELNYSAIFKQAFQYQYLELAKLVARDHRIARSVLNVLMEDVKSTATYETIDYLISLGGNDYDGLVSRIVINDNIELFKRYYLSPGLNYLETFYEGLAYSSLKVIKFMIKQHLVPVTEKKMNRYLKVVGLNPKLIELLLSLGATDYRTIVERGLIQGELALAKKYFDRAPGLELNSVFKLCTEIPVYQYIMSRGRIKQKTVDATLARLSHYKYEYMDEKKYLSSLSLQD